MTQPVYPERELALSYAPQRVRAGLAALLALDETLACILRTTRDPLVGQMRLTWWFEALAALDHAPPLAQPVLEALASEALPNGVTGVHLTRMIEGWELLLDPEPLDRGRLEVYAAERGATLFELAGRLLGASERDPLRAAGAGWVLADLAAHARDKDEAALTRLMAATALHEAMARQWTRNGRALGALALSARMDLAGEIRPGAPGRVARLAWHRLSGR